MSTPKNRKGLTADWFIIQKKTIYQIIGGIIALVLLIAFLIYRHYYPSKGGDTIPEARTARVLKVEGRVTIRHAATNEVEQASPNMPLEPGDTIQTALDGSAVVEYSDASRYNIKSGSTFILKENSRRDKYFINKLEKGEVKVYTQETADKHILTAGDAKTIVDKNTDVGVNRGDNKTIVTVTHGGVGLFIGSGPEQRVQEQEIAEVIDGTPTATIKKQPPAPLLAKPENAKEFLIPREETIELSWQPTPEAASYILSISPNVSFNESALILNQSNISDTKYVWAKPLQGNFFWRVKVVTKDGIEGIWSEPGNFKVKFKGGIPVPVKITKIEIISQLLYVIEGVTKPGAILKVNDINTDLDASGAFKANVTFAPKAPRIFVLDVQDANGNSGHIEVPAK